MSGGSTLTISSDGSAEFEHVYLTGGKDAEIINSGAYTIKATVKTGDTELPMAFSIDGNKISVSTKILGTITARIFSDGENVYLVIPAFRVYVNAGTADELIGDNEYLPTFADPGSWAQNQDAVYVKSGKTTINGNEYYFDEYSAKDIESLKYYYQANSLALKQIEAVDTDGTVSLINIKSVSADVPSDAFSIPSGYKDMTEIFMRDGYEGVLAEAEKQ